MGNSPTKQVSVKPESPDENEVNVRIVRTYFDTPRNLALLEIESVEKYAEFSKMENAYYVTIKDRGLRTIERKLCSRDQAKQHIDEWLKKYKCTVRNGEAICV